MTLYRPDPHLASAPLPSTSCRSPAAGPYAQSLIAYGTMHGKQSDMTGPFSGVLDTRVVAPVAIDTDQVGTP